MKKSQLKNIIREIINEQSNPYVCYDSNCLLIGTNVWYQSYVNGGAPTFPNLTACQASCGTTPTPPTPGPTWPGTSAGSCNPAAWSNHANFLSTFTNTVANHNNPCNFLNQKIAQFTSNLQGTGGGNYQNMLNCKLDIANDLHTQNNC